MKKTIEELIDDLDEDIKKSPWVNARFGDKWKVNSKSNYDQETILDIAFKNGRKVVLLENYLREFYETQLQNKVREALEEIKESWSLEQCYEIADKALKE